MEEAVQNLETQMQRTDQRLDSLASQVGYIESEIFSEEGGIEVTTLLRSVNEVKTNYQNLRKEISEVHDLQKQLSSTLQLQMKLMQTKFNVLKEKITTNVPQIEKPPHSKETDDVPNLLLEVPEWKGSKDK